MDTIKKYLEDCFAKAPKTDELKEMFEEILDNCRERYEDGLKSGLSPAAAEQAVMDSLEGVEELVKEAADGDVADGDVADDGAAVATGSDSAPAGTSLAEVEVADGLPATGESLNTLEVSLKTADLHIEKSPDSHVRVKVQKSFRSRLKASEQNGVYRIEEMGNTKIINFFKAQKGAEIYVYIPEAIRKIKGELGTGDVRMSGIDAESIELDVGTGDANLKGVTATKVEIDAGTGDIALEDLSAVKVDLDAGTGDITAQGLKARKIEADAATGNVTLATIGEFEKIKVDSVSGDVRIIPAGVESVDFKHESLSGKGTCNLPQAAGANKIIVETMSGDVTVE